MALPTKEGIDYFPMSTQKNVSMRLVEAEFGLTGFAVIVKLWELIYSERGYYCEWTNEVALLFADSINVGGSVVSEIVSAAIKRGIFDKNIFEKYQVLTSDGVQKRYLEAVSRRKKVFIKDDYLLVSAAILKDNVYIIGENVDITGENVDISKQSKVKKSKVKKSKDIPPISPKGESEVLKSTKEDMFNQFWDAYPKKTAKSHARDIFFKKKSAELRELLPIMLKAISEQKKSDAWKKDGGQYIPNPSTWLNQGRWEDEPMTTDTNKSGRAISLDFDEYDKLADSYIPEYKPNNRED